MLSTVITTTNQLTWSDLLDNPELKELQKRILTVLRSAYSSIIAVPLMNVYDNAGSYVQTLLEDFRLKISRGSTKEIIEELFVRRSEIHPNTWVKDPVIDSIQGSIADFAIDDTLIYCENNHASFMKYLFVRFLTGNERYSRFLQFNYNSKTINIHQLCDNSEFENVVPLLRDYYNKIYTSKLSVTTETELETPVVTSKTEATEAIHEKNGLVHRIQRIFLNQVHLRESIAKSRATLAAQEVLFKAQEREIETFWNQRKTIQAQLDKVSTLEELQRQHNELVEKVRELIENKSNGPQFSICLTQLEQLIKQESQS
jgi:hypothetical protein